MIPVILYRYNICSIFQILLIRRWVIAVLSESRNMQCYQSFIYSQGMAVILVMRQHVVLSLIHI